MDWVEQRVNTEQLLNVRAPELWRDLCTALEEAVKSFQRHYQFALIKADFEKLHDNARIVRVRPNGPQSKADEIGLVFAPDSRSISVRVNDNRETHIIVIEGDSGDRAWLSLDGKRLTPDQLSQLLLEPFLFPAAVTQGSARGMRTVA